MKKLILIGYSLLITITTTATPPDTTLTLDLSYPTLVESKYRDNDNLNTGIVLLTSGLLLTGIGIVNEMNREPYPTHSTAVNHNPDAPQPLNLMLIGAGIGLSGYGIKMVFTF